MRRELLFGDEPGQNPISLICGRSGYPGPKEWTPGLLEKTVAAGTGRRAAIPSLKAIL